MPRRPGNWQRLSALIPAAPFAVTLPLALWLTGCGDSLSSLGNQAQTIGFSPDEKAQQLIALRRAARAPDTSYQDPFANDGRFFDAARIDGAPAELVDVELCR
jgi:hypothetical protein